RPPRRRRGAARGAHLARAGRPHGRDQGEGGRRRADPRGGGRGGRRRAAPGHPAPPGRGGAGARRAAPRRARRRAVEGGRGGRGGAPEEARLGGRGAVGGHRGGQPPGRRGAVGAAGARPARPHRRRPGRRAPAGGGLGPAGRRAGPRRRRAGPPRARRAVPADPPGARQGEARKDRRGHRPEAPARDRGAGSGGRPLPARAARPAVGGGPDRRRRGVLAVRGRVLGRRVRGVAVRSALIVIAALAAPSVARAQSATPMEVEVETDKSAAADLYVKRRPPVPESPRLPPELEKRLVRAERAADAKRDEAIRLLRQFLASKPTGDGRAEGLFKLAELLWEDARRTYITRMDAWERKVEACRQRRSACRGMPREPEMDLREPEKLYRTILEDHPRYRRRDLVLYLVGFAAREDDRTEEALAVFQQLIAEHPD